MAEKSLEEKKANRDKMGKEPPGLDDKIRKANEVYCVICICGAQPTSAIYPFLGWSKGAGMVGREL